MGWSLGWDNEYRRDIGYGVPAWCDHPKCNAKIDRGLAYVCGGEPFGGDTGCGLYFCSKHISYYNAVRRHHCSRCGYYKRPFEPKPDHPEWVHHKLHDPSWQKWRDTQPLADLVRMAPIAAQWTPEAAA